MTRRSHPRDERGSGSALTLSAAVLILAVAWLGMSIVGWIDASHRARNSADLAALAGAHGVRAGVDACAESRRIAQAHGAHVASCSVRQHATGYWVSVRVEVQLQPRFPGGPTLVHEDARAGVE